MRDRVFGIENEFGVMVEHPDGSFDYTFDPSNNQLGILLTNRIFSKDKSLGFMPEKHGGLWLPNGGCVYVDMQAYLEYASPECRRVRDLVAYAKAGEAILEAVAAAPSSDGTRLRFIKTSVAPDYIRNTLESFNSGFVTLGAHENYLFFEKNATGLFEDGIEADHKRRAVLLPFMSFLVTRQIFDGAGWWMPSEYGSYSFSQRAEFIETEIDRNTTSKRPIINTRPEHHIDDDPPGYARGDLKRLHLILGDANILDAAMFLKFGTTALALSLLEEGKLPDVRLRDPVRAHKIVSRSYDANSSNIELENGTCVSALCVQSLFYEKARRYLAHTGFESEESEAEALEILALWEDALNAIADNNVSWMLGRLDHATKRALADRGARTLRAGKSHYSSETELREAYELMYHEVGGHGLSQKMRDRWSSRCIASDEAIRRAICDPPKDTRAYARGMAVQRYIRDAFPLKDVKWNQLRWGSVPLSALGHVPEFPAYSCPNPLNPRPPWFKEMCRGT